MTREIKVGAWWEKDGGVYPSTIADALEMVEAWRRTQPDVHADQFVFLLAPGVTEQKQFWMQLPDYVSLRGYPVSK